MKKIEQEARQRILDRGKIEFRVEPELMAAVLDLAKERKLPLGPMIRQWVSERVAQETKGTRSKTQLDVIENKIDKLLAKKTGTS
ncbi:MAG: hypothetical protein K2Y22_12085 [Candidatus Obscuribacterales bacterium]|nr:hypothetical protein [Candidatus Obscuribacterales bacterium]